MYFNSISFVYFLVIVFSIYWLPLKNSKLHQNVTLLLASYIFYGWWDYRFLVLIIFSSLVDFFIGKQIHKQKNNSVRKRYLLVSILVNLGLLMVFKYFNFFVESFLAAFSVTHSENLFKIILPVGISFYTFQTLSYTIDIYRQELKPSEKVIDFLTFVSFFPQLVAGPIERARNFLPQIQTARTFSYKNAVMGCRHILYGMFKKVVIADNLAEIVNIIFATDAQYSGVINLIGIVFFAIQIYCDFSGYSAIAIGTAKLLNINLMQNFDFPYFSKSLAEFWSRWHISLSTWFRDYLYIPLGGSKFSTTNTVRNLFLTFLISGLWHGANWTFIIWGAIHGFFLVLEKFVFIKLKLYSIISRVSAIGIVLLSWVFFRAENILHAINYLKQTFNFDNSVADQTKLLLANNSEVTVGQLAIVSSLTIFFVLFEFVLSKRILASTFDRKLVFRLAVYIIFVNIILLFGSYRTPSEFIYFQF